MNDQKKKFVDSALTVFRVVAVTILLPWVIWITRSTLECHWFMERGSRFTYQQGHEMELRLRERDGELQRQINKLPPEQLLERIRKIEVDIARKHGKTP